MGINDRELHEKMQKLASIDARLAQHESITRLGIACLTVLGLLAFIFLAYHVVRL